MPFFHGFNRTDYRRDRRNLREQPGVSIYQHFKSSQCEAPGLPAMQAESGDNGLKRMNHQKTDALFTLAYTQSIRNVQLSQFALKIAGPW